MVYLLKYLLIELADVVRANASDVGKYSTWSIWVMDCEMCVDDLWKLFDDL